MDGTELFSTVERIWRASLPPSIPPRIADQFIAVSRAKLVAFIDELLAAKRARSAQETQQVDDPQIPAGLEPETFGLIHEYYTPLQIADAIAEHVCPLLPELAGHDGVVRVPEPSAGVGRFLRAMGRPQCMPFERFVREHGSQYAGRINLVLSNPPYGERGITHGYDGTERGDADGDRGAILGFKVEPISEHEGRGLSGDWED